MAKIGNIYRWIYGRTRGRPLILIGLLKENWLEAEYRCLCVN
jgi:hypothetical protein